MKIKTVSGFVIVIFLSLTFYSQKSVASSNNIKNHFVNNAFADTISKIITLHVSPNVSLKSDGSIKNPFKSIAEAQKKVRTLILSKTNGLIKVIIHGGTYELNQPLLFAQEDSGNENLEITYEAAKGEKPIISGASNLKPTQLNSNLWTFRIPQYRDNLFDVYINGNRATKARTPNRGFFNLDSVKENIADKIIDQPIENATQQFYFPQNATKAISELSPDQLRKVRFNAFFKWDNMIRFLTKKGNDNGEFISEGKKMQPWNQLGKMTRFYLENYPAALDTIGEWYFEKGILKYIPSQSDKKLTTIISLPKLDKLLIIEGDTLNNKKVEKITFKGLSFLYSNYSLHQEGFEPIQAASTVEAAIMINGARNIYFDQCEIGHTGQHGIWFKSGCSDCSMKQCMIYDLGAGGIRIGETIIPKDARLSTHNITIENCIIHSGGYNFPSGVGVWIGQSANNTIRHNDIGDFRYTGVSVGWVWGYAFSPAKNNKIMYNRIHHIGWALLSDMAGVYTLGQSEGTEVSNNVVYDIYSYSYGGWGLYPDEGTSNIRMENNLVMNTKTGGFHQHYGKENIIRNNIFAFADNYQLQCTRVEPHLSFTFENNIVVGNKGVLLQGPWFKINVKMDRNCYWFENDAPFNFNGKSIIEWINAGRDKSSLVQSPGTIDAKNQTFKLKPELAKAIGFKIFNPDEAGVYGDMEWIQKSKLAPSIIKSFNEMVSENKRLNPQSN